MLNKKSITLIFVHFLSLFGTHMGDFALSLHLYEKSGSIFMYSMFSLFIILPEMLFAPIFGAFADKYNKKYLMLLGHGGAGLGSIAILILLSIGFENMSVYLALVGISSVFNSLVFASFNVTLAEETDEEKMHVLGSVIQIGFALVFIVSPALAAFLLADYGLINVFYIDVLTFSTALVTISLMKFPHISKKKDTNEGALVNLINEMKEGFAYLKTDSMLSLSLVLLALVNFSMATVAVLMTPLVLSMSDVSTVGVVMSISGVGMLVGSAVMLGFKSKHYLYWMNRLVVPMALILFLVLFNLSITLLSIGAFIFMLFVGMIGVLNYTYWQNSVEPELRGRLLGLRNSVLTFSMVIGYLASAPLSQSLMSLILNKSSFIHTILGTEFHPEIRLLFGVNAIFLILVALYIEVKRRRVVAVKGDVII